MTDCPTCGLPAVFCECTPPSVELPKCALCGQAPYACDCYVVDAFGSTAAVERGNPPPRDYGYPADEYTGWLVPDSPEDPDRSWSARDGGHETSDDDEGSD